MDQGARLGGRYRLDERIGAGGMGEVWRGTDEVLGRTVAVKVVLPLLASDPEFVRRFLAEARAMASVNHPGVVSIHDYGQDPAGAYLVMEYVESEPLSRALGRVGRLNPGAAMHVVAQAALALQAVHDRGIVHRDVKPANLLVRPDGAVALTDFGVAFGGGTALTSSGALLGTPSYLAPEQVLGEPATARSDIYALGVVAYECLVGRVPFDGPDPVGILLAHVEQPLPDPYLEDPEARALFPIVRRLLEKHPDDRFADAHAMLAALGVTSDTTMHLTQTQSFTAPLDFTPPPGSLGRAARRLGRHPMARVGLVVGVALAAAVAFLPGGTSTGGASCPPATGAGAATWSVSLQPPATVRPGDFVDVVWDVCGMAPASATTTTVVMRSANPKVAGRDARRHSIVYLDTIEGAAVRRTRRIRLPSVTPGDYALSIVVRPARGRTQVDTKPLRIDWQKR
jgi:serine/threonine-protein kinase